jgi:hypothetical protein
MLSTTFTTAVSRLGFGVDGGDSRAATLGETLGLAAASVVALAKTAIFLGSCGATAGSVEGAVGSAVDGSAVDSCEVDWSSSASSVLVVLDDAEEFGDSL